MARLRDVLTAERRGLGEVVRAAPATPGASWAARLRPRAREVAVIWLLRAGILAYLFGLVSAAEAGLLALRRLF